MTTKFSLAIPHRRVLALVLAVLTMPLFAQEFNEPAEEITENKLTTWVGNSFGGRWNGARSYKSKDFGRSRRGHVPMGIDAIAVVGDGTVYTRAFQPDESHKQYAVFSSEGDDLGQLGWYHNGSQPTHTETRGDAIAANDKYIVAENSRRVERTIDGQRKRITDYGRLRVFSRATGMPTKKSTQRDPDVNVSDNVTGLAIYGNELYVSDNPEGRILVYNLDTLAKSYSSTPLRTFPFEDPGSLTVDGQGHLWIARRSDNRIYQYSRAGVSRNTKIVPPAGTIVGDVQYNSSTDNPYSGLLMIVDNGPDLNIKFYDPRQATSSPNSSNPKTTFGQRGGIYAGVRGQYAPDKFRGKITGVDNDAAGNLYVSMAGKQRVNAHTSLLSFTPSGAVRWDRHNLAFIDTGVMDPRAENEVYSEYYRYDVAYDRGVENNLAKGWSIKGYTMDVGRYPDDIRHVSGIKYYRVGQAMAPLKVTYVEDQKIIFYGNQLGTYLAAFRVSPETDGEILIPCFVMSKEYRPQMPWPANRPRRTGAWMWMDENGDGQMDGDEFVSAEKNYKGWAWDIDDDGGIWWFASSSGSIRHSKILGLNDHGVPRYTFTDVESYQTPEMFRGIKRLVYDDDADAMYLTGYTTEYPNYNPHTPDKKTWSACAGRVMGRFDNWSGGNREPTWVLDNLQYEPRAAIHSDIFITSVDEAGDYLFLGRNSGTFYASGSRRGQKEPNTRKVEVYRKSDGQPVGYLLPGPTAGHGIGQLDMIFGIRAFQRQNGQYLIFEEDDWFGNILLHQWSPAGGPADGGVFPIADALVWDGSRRNDNFGASTKLAAKHHSSAVGFTRRSFLRFDASGVDKSRPVELVLTPRSIGNESTTLRQIQVRAVRDNEWQETGITFINQPAVQELLGTIDITARSVDEPVTIDVSDYLAGIDGDVVSFAIVQPRGQNAYVSLGSRESSTPPVLRNAANASGASDAGRRAVGNNSPASSLSESRGSTATILYPNPVSDMLRIAGGPQVSEIRIVNLMGQTMLERRLKGVREVDVTALPTGAYVVTTRDVDGGTRQFKIVKR